MSDIEFLRERLSAFWQTRVSDSGVQSITFQPFLKKKIEDRIAVEEWDIHGQRWVFMAVCDGHAGAQTSEYTAVELPKQIHNALSAMVQGEVRSELNRGNVVEVAPTISAMLSREVEVFDAMLGGRVKAICPEPGALTEGEARATIQENFDPLMLAWSGTTLAAALVNVTLQCVWAFGVGDSSVVLSTINADGTRHAQRLCAQHSMGDPAECARIVSEHSPDEAARVVEKGRVLGWLMLPRAIGDFALKLPSSYMSHLLKYLPTTGKMPLDGIPERIKTPPYLIATPSVQFTDLEPVWDRAPTVLLFSDGVDLLVDGSTLFHPGVSSNADPCDIVSKLLQDKVDTSVEEVLGHGIDPHWSGPEGNKALDLLGNLIGGKDAERLELMMDQECMANIKSERPSPFYVDDVAIVVYPLPTSR
ncbi:protein serine/threonine phosphatase 2C [Lentinus tigrinus ALCF2SS1-7]|uniref:Protein serine/threonine phosphatase 2C n=1 Tax=Lentinus tigrinus ALCF2SS1-6 TaxID=1328759 RepID=A0A5C2SDE8_9APHY|nr:protein serine/threonine phosphatase 2C [Lentinus tigrinus ALCF2SS1-6]RPD75268.1 protein serine/threonine phosphatase 2C [Lentinus tigrinus ALCF2SS1-7]